MSTLINQDMNLIEEASVNAASTYVCKQSKYENLAPAIHPALTVERSFSPRHGSLRIAGRFVSPDGDLTEEERITSDRITSLIHEAGPL